MDQMDQKDLATASGTYSKKINAAWRGAFDKVLETGRLLLAAKLELGTKAWGEMVDTELVFSRVTARKLITIIKDERLTSAENAEFLPPSWSILHTLRYLTDEQFEAALAEGIIHPAMMRRDAERLKKRKTPPKPKPVVATPSKEKNSASSDEVNSEVEEAVEGALAIIRPPEAMTDECARNIEYKLEQLKEEYGISFSFNGYSSTKAAKTARRHNLAKKMQGWHERTSQKYNRNQTMTAKELRLYEDIIWQLQTGRTFRINDDGSYHLNDLRHPDNPYHHAMAFKNEPEEMYHVLEDVYSECDSGFILTQYTPLEYFDYFSYLNLLVYEHCVGNRERREEIESRLRELDAKEHEIRDAYIATEKMRKEGKAYSDYMHLIPAVATDFRNTDLEKSVDIEPGFAAATYEMLIR